MRIIPVKSALPRNPSNGIGTVLLMIFIIAITVPGCGIGSYYIQPGEPRISPSTPGSNSSWHDGRDGITETLSGHDQPVYTIYLLGDAGYADETNSASLSAVEREASENPGHSLVVFLGDNVYSDGMPARDHPMRMRAEKILGRQMAVMVNSGAKGLFIPGNHDWDGMGENGEASIIEQEIFVSEYAEAHRGARIELRPGGALPGPSLIVDNEVFRIIALDGQWWLHKYARPLYPGTASVEETEARFADSLKRLTEGYDGVIFLFTHNPLETHGPHGGFFTWKDHLFPLTQLEPWLWLPLPGLGSLYPIARKNGYSPVDVSSDEYQHYISTLRSVLDDAGPVIVGSGHEHAQQVIHVSDNILNLVSGGGILHHTSPVSAGENTLFASETAGYMVVSIDADGSVRLRVMGVHDSSSPPEELYRRVLVEGKGNQR